MGKRPSERRHQELSAADWMGLEIAELVGLSVAKSEATCLFVKLSQTRRSSRISGAPRRTEIAKYGNGPT